MNEPMKAPVVSPLDALKPETVEALQDRQESRGLPPDLQARIGKQWEESGIPEVHLPQPKETTIDDAVALSADYSINPERIRGMRESIEASPTLSEKGKADQQAIIDRGTEDLVSGPLVHKAVRCRPDQLRTLEALGFLNATFPPTRETNNYAVYSRAALVEARDKWAAYLGRKTEGGEL